MQPACTQTFTVTLADASSDDGLAVDITPTADRTTLGDAGSYRRRFQVANASASRGFFAQQTVTAVDSSNATNTMKTWVYVPPVNEALFHDADGNLRRDARWEYHWDAENRLAVMEERPGIPAYPASATDKPARQRLEFFYDAKHRRSAKRVFHWDTATGTWTTWAYTLYLYDGWNLVAELDLLNGGTPQRTYTWGTDLSGTMSGAGGVGGLLMVKRHQRSASADTSLRALVHSDANGNVMGLYSIEAAKMLGSFDYDAFGNKVVNTVAMGNEVCPIGFSSKYEDKETAMLYYGFRYYSPELGRWLSRDPIGIRGGLNLYAMCRNDAINLIDRLGLIEITVSSENFGAAANWLGWKAAMDAQSLGDKDGYEYGGSICAACCGKDARRLFTTGPTKSGTGNYNTLRSKDPSGNYTDICPKGTIAVGGYHSHPKGGGGPSGWDPDPTKRNQDWGRFNPRLQQGIGNLNQAQVDMNPNDNLSNPDQLTGPEDPEYVGHDGGVSKIPSNDANRPPLKAEPPKPPVTTCK